MQLSRTISKSKPEELSDWPFLAMMVAQYAARTAWLYMEGLQCSFVYANAESTMGECVKVSPISGISCRKVVIVSNLADCYVTKSLALDANLMRGSTRDASIVIDFKADYIYYIHLLQTVRYNS